MDLKPILRKYAPLVSFIIIIILIISGWILYLPIMRIPQPPGGKKAIILSSANDFYRKEGEPGFNDGEDGRFDSEPFPPKWAENFGPNEYGGIDSSIPGHDTPGVIQLIVTSPPTLKAVNTEFVYNWTKYHPLVKYAAYNLSAWVNITTNINTPPILPAVITPPGAGARIGLRWLNSSNDIIRTDWSAGLFGPFSGWNFLNVTGIAASNKTEITQLHLILAVEGNMTGTNMVLFDDIKVEYWFPPPIPSPPPSNQDTDGFPAQALHIYWILKDHGYTDDDIFLMLYHTGDDIIDIDASDGFSNDLNRSGILAEIDVENNDVNASRFKRELNVAISGSFASSIKPRDQLIIYMVDHGSNKVLGDGNATFHFEADDSYITEIEFVNLVRLINCKRMLINIDICFSGNFLNEDLNIGSSWYDIPKSILITSTTNLLSWYWRDNNNADGFAGSFFFHRFWDGLNQNRTIENAFDLAINSIPSGQLQSINTTQSPLIHDNLGIIDVLSFNNTPQL
ncbi:MAG: C13 family peptidase [Candidatus Thorarchaeota archaeon]